MTTTKEECTRVAHSEIRVKLTLLFHPLSLRPFGALNLCSVCYAAERYVTRVEQVLPFFSSWCEHKKFNLKIVSSSHIVLQASGMIMLSVGIWFQIGLHRYMELSTYYTNSFQILLVTVGLIIIFIASIACCCTLKAESSILYLVREEISLLLLQPFFFLATPSRVDGDDGAKFAI